MRADHNIFVRLFAPTNFRNHIVLHDGTTNLIWNIQSHPESLSGGQKSYDALRVFPSDDSLGQTIETPVRRICVAIEQKVLARRHPNNCGCSRGNASVDNSGR